VHARVVDVLGIFQSSEKPTDRAYLLGRLESSLCTLQKDENQYSVLEEKIYVLILGISIISSDNIKKEY